MKPDCAREAIEAFLGHARRPALLEPGEDMLPLVPGGYEVQVRGSRLTIQAWDRTRNLVRRVTRIAAESPGRLELEIERFARKPGKLFLLDLDRPAGAEMGRRSGRLVFRERFRMFLRRQFPSWTLAEISAEADLEHSLSPAYPRAFLKHGQHGFAAIAAPPDADAAGVLTFGLVWLAYLRGREKRLSVEGLAIYVAAGQESAAALRLPCLDPSSARFELFSYTQDDAVAAVDPGDHGNLDTHLEICRTSGGSDQDWREVAALPGVEAVLLLDGRVSLRVRGIEFAEASGALLRFGLSQRHAATTRHLPEIARLVEELDRVRSADSPDREHPLYRQSPEAWLESTVRASLETLDASLDCAAVYGQVPAFTGGDRGVIDLLAAGRDGRLAVVELKASSDIHLPMQALDYWIRVKWHLDRGEFTPAGYFPGVALRSEPPRLLLVCPALDFHPTVETVLGFFSPAIDVVRIGVGVEWRKGLHVMFRLSGAERP